MFIKVQNVSKYYVSGSTSVRALHDVSLSIKKGEFVSIAGPSGSGKTTLLNLIGGIDHPSEGKIFVDGKEISSASERELSKYRREYMGFVFQRFYLLPQFTVLENLTFPAEFTKKYKKNDLRSIAIKLLEYVGIAHKSDRYPTELSGGEAQRVAIARALINRPKIILADEPTGELDSENTENIISLFKKLNFNDKITVIIATHDPEVWKRSQRIIRLKDGGVVHGGK
ncbi:MAG: ABC transporter ATP-binding protein [Euryarchaeota archaeon]|nr:ABC transporter ATP-binding protein [Euryarchaeota archaeon]